MVKICIITAKAKSEVVRCHPRNFLPMDASFAKLPVNDAASFRISASEKSEL